MRYYIIICLLLILPFSCKDKQVDSVSTKEANNKQLETQEFVEININLSSGKLLRLEALPSNFIRSRPVDVWLPENYTTKNRYSVLYMHDGQMLFDGPSTWNKQEWEVDEWATKLMLEEKTENFIVVAIHNIAEIRWEDLFPQKCFEFIPEDKRAQLKSISGSKEFKLNGDNYLKFIVKELKPIIDSTFSVSKDRDNTFIMGSSMGGLMSMYAISEYPEIFAGGACLSTHWVGALPVNNNPFPQGIFNYMQQNFPLAGKHKIYFDYGNKTLDAHYPQYAPEVDRILKLKGYTVDDSRNLFFEGTNHSENSWNQRLDIPLTFLLGKRTD
ncbi:alpha/beta hydrolase [Winogradskyella sp. A2]|uniref:alpha/beta hydrolase n=1 Tax=Winogradskyella sp. A2 TaxID=3366944 RepID=UPI00398C3289